MRAMLRPAGAVLGLTLSWLPALAQNAQVPGGIASDYKPPQPAQTAPAAAPNAVVATVNGQPIYEIAVQRGLMRVPPDKHVEARAQVVNFLVEQVLLDQYLLQLQIPIDSKDVEKAVAEIKGELEKRKQDFGKMLQEVKMSEAELRDHIAADLRWGKLAEERANDKVLRELFDSQKSLFDGSTVRARHILLKPADDSPAAAEQTLAQITALKQQIEKQVADGLAKLPADTDNLTREKKRQAMLEEAFMAQAREKSACPTKAQGGDVGPPFQGVGFMVEPFSRAAFALKPFDLSEPVKTPYGYHLILVTERKPGRDVKFEEVKEMVKELYCTGLHDNIISEARQRSKIVINK